MSTEQPGLTPAGKLVVFLVIAGLVVGAGWMLRGKILPKKCVPRGEDITREDLGIQAEAADGSSITTASEYEYVAEDRLPPVKGTSDYRWDEKQKIVNFPINVWIGWLPIIAANHGATPNEDSIFYKKFGFKVKLSLIDKPAKALHVCERRKPRPVGHA